MSKSLQNQIQSMKSVDITPNSLSFISTKFTSISPENLEDLPFDSIYSLLQIIDKLTKYFKSSPILEAKKAKYYLKTLSSEISTYIFLINFHYPIDKFINPDLGGLNYHELETIAIKSQGQILSKLEELNSKREVIRTKSHYFYYSLKLILQKPSFELMTFEYSQGLSAFFPHEDEKIKAHKNKTSQYVDQKLHDFQKKYGSGFIKKVHTYRKKWDNDYFSTYKNTKNDLHRIFTEKERIFEALSGDKSINSETSLSDSSINSDPFDIFYEGPACYTVGLSLVDLDLCRIRCSIKAFDYVADDIEILVEW